ncbi:MAG TPA: DUF58 domain-containing protein [Gaiellaceae bacterium]
MTVHATPKLVAYVGLATGGLLAAVVFGSPELAVLAVPFAAIAAWGAVRAGQPQLEVDVVVERDRLLVGDTLLVDLTLRSDVSLLADVTLELPQGVEFVGDKGQPVRLRASEPTELAFSVACRRFGRVELGRVRIRASDGLGLLRFEQLADRSSVVRIYPRPEPLRALLAPSRVGSTSGDLLSRTKGDGLEFADIRELQAGDRIRRVNWSATSRRGRIHVNQYHPERNADVLVFLDVLTDAPDQLNRAAAAALALAERHLRRRDNVGLVCYGATTSWIAPRSGREQLHRITETLLHASFVDASLSRPISALPSQLLRPRALIIALTPLHDLRTLRALLDLRGRGFDLVVIELPVEPALAAQSDDPVERLWRLKRKAVRAWCASAGALVVEWPTGVPLAAAIEEAHEWRRGALRASG